jgi:ketosteroid isomerase-like protein
MSSDDVTQINDMVQRWIQAFCVVDSETMKTFWPRDHPDLVYQSEEIAVALSTYEEIAAYWDHVPETLESIPAVEDADVRIHVHGDVATVYLYALASAKFPGAERLYRAPFRASIVLRRLDEGWRYVHYHESRILDLDAVTAALNAGEEIAGAMPYGAARS